MTEILDVGLMAQFFFMQIDKDLIDEELEAFAQTMFYFGVHLFIPCLMPVSVN
jgi:hypothetical protein